MEKERLTPRQYGRADAIYRWLDNNPDLKLDLEAARKVLNLNTRHSAQKHVQQLTAAGWLKRESGGWVKND